MLNSIKKNPKNSLIVQTSFLFLLSSIFIVILWIAFYMQQKYQYDEHNIARYFNVASSLRPFLIQAIPIDNSNLSVFNMKLYSNTIPKKHKVIFKRGNKSKGFRVIEFEDKKVIYIYSPISEIVLQDIQKSQSMLIVHGVFLLLLISQILLYIRVKKSLKPLSLMQKKLQTLEDGDLTPLQLESNYDEIKQMILSYNKSIAKIEYILNTREMFNKIFMHEMKMPIAKGMFYLKQEVSQKTHNKLGDILHRLNQELDEFSQLENLISYKDEISDTPNNILAILNEAIEKVGIENKEKILIKCDNSCTIKGDRDLWILCFKNIIDNALKYSYDNHLQINCINNEISFINQGEPLPVDLSNNIKSWKLDKNQRHKSSTGYGFGLFIIKTIVSINKYRLDYLFDAKEKLIKLTIF